jgi:hypothetical protein
MPWPAQTWNALKKGTPGRRFASVYEERHRRRAGTAARPAAVATAIALLFTGTLLVFTPGPGAAVILLGATLLASESLRVAHALDWCELKARAVLRRLVI